MRHNNKQGKIQGGQIHAFVIHTSQDLVGELEFGQKGFHKLCQSNSTNICNFK
jgi:hypothetical protein